jgi:hypothetical protein
MHADRRMELNLEGEGDSDETRDVSAEVRGNLSAITYRLVNILSPI